MDLYLFSDEAGCFTFNRQPNVSRYFIICSVTMTKLDIVVALARLRHDLVRKGLELGDYFHATTDVQAVRDAVFAELQNHQFHVQATICEKSKAQPQVRASKARFYQYPWYYHFKHGVTKHVGPDYNLIVTAASIGNRKEKVAYSKALTDVMQQHLKADRWAIDFRQAMADACLQVADYCAWAIQRKWERGDSRSHKLIESKISYEYELWRHGTRHYY